MKQIVWVSVVASVFLSACATPPTIDYTTFDAVCGRKCQSEDSACKSRFADYPLLMSTHCKPELNKCVKACPPPGTNPPESSVSETEIANASNDKRTVSQRLHLLEELHKNGDITDKEYADKRQEIIKSL